MGLLDAVGVSTKVKSGAGINPERRVNSVIVAWMLRPIKDEGHKMLSRYEVLNRAQESGLNLVEVEGKAESPRVS
jgi:translation initiation factor IF-3